MIRIGGSFAPPLTDEKLAAYKSLISSLGSDSPVADAMGKLLACCEKWWAMPESTGTGRPHPVGKGFIVDLDQGIAKDLWDHIPWDHELAAIQSLLDEMPSGTSEIHKGGGNYETVITDQAAFDRRNAAFHLLWHVKELAMDREPITNDKL